MALRVSWQATTAIAALPMLWSPGTPGRNRTVAREDQLVALEFDAGRSAQPTLAPPVAVFAPNRSSTVRARRCIVSPTQTDNRRTSHREHCRRRTRRADRRHWPRPSPRARPGLVATRRRPFALHRTIELIPRQVQQHDKRCVEARKQRWQCELIDLEHRELVARPRRLLSSATTPDRRLAPSTFDATVDPPAAQAALRSAVVVDFPFVPDTTAMRRPAASSSSASGAAQASPGHRSPILRHGARSRDVALAAVPSATATRVRADRRDGPAIDSVTRGG